MYGHKCWKKSSKIGRPDWTTSEPAVAVLCQKSYLKWVVEQRRLGRSSLMLKEIVYWSVCQQFEPSATEDLPCRGDRCTFNLSKLKRSLVGVLWKLREWGCRIRCHPRHLTIVQNDEVRRQKPSSS
ncbi:hypothetical protein TNCV_526481 [Trichonephila clavipes]|nr:hypothetical protein TNCV_526481 [Trichonephila clavipes]